jgi:hypothetical protein
MEELERHSWRFDLKRWKRLSAWVFVLGLTLSLINLTGCDDDPVDPPDPCIPSLQMNLIITNPLTPAPGDTTLLTIQAEGEGCDNWANYTWSVEAGELLQTTGITVQWVAPMEFGAYEIECRGSLSGASSQTSEALVMIRQFEYLDTGRIASIKPTFMLGNLYFIAEEGNVGPRSSNFLGWCVYQLGSTGRVSLITDTEDPAGGGSYEFAFAGSGEAIYGSFFTAYYSGLRQQRMNVWKFPTMFGSPVNASDDPGGGGILRKNQHRFPMTNEVGNKAVWKFEFAGARADGTEDLFNIAFWDEMDGPRNWYTVTTSNDSSTAIIGPDTVTIYRYFNNIKPMFTPSEDNIIYFVDTTGVFEPCLIPMFAGAPDTTQRRALMVDEQTGIFEQAGISVNENTVFQWNPAMPFVAFISLGEIFFFDYGSETVSKVDGLSQVTEFAWSSDGSQLAAVNDNGIFLVSSGGVVNPDPVFLRERATDGIHGIAWNEDLAEPLLAFRLVRKGKSEVDSWSSLVIADLTAGLWAYASETVQWHSSREPAQIDYTWMRCVFDEDGTGVYAPVPVLDSVNYPGKDIILIYSHE